jgi:hypothetical protein
MAVHWLDQEAFLREAQRLLRPRAYLSIDNYGFTGKMMPDNGFESFHSEFYRTHFPSPTRNADYPEEVVCKSFGFRLHKDIYYEHLVEMNQEQFMARVSRKRTKKRLRDNVRNRTGIFRFGSKDTKTETTAPRQPVGNPSLRGPFGELETSRPRSTNLDTTLRAMRSP